MRGPSRRQATGKVDPKSILSIGLETGVAVIQVRAWRVQARA